MKAFVTGANGFTGSHLVKHLQQQGYQVKGLVRQSSNLSRLANCDLELVYGDLTHRQVLQDAIADIDTIFHTAAYVDLGLVDEAEMERVNVEGTRTILEVAQSARISKIVYCSTIGVFGDTQGQVVDETFQRTQQDFSSAYDRTKYQAQQLVDGFFQQGLPVVSIMPSGIFGRDDPHFGPVIQLFLKRQLKVWPGGDRVTGIVHVDDLVQGMILAAQNGKPGEHYILSSGELTTREMFAILSEETGIPLPADPPELLVRLVGRLIDPIGKLLSWNPPISRERVRYIYDRCVRVQATKAHQELGWQSRSVSEILKELVR
ncbi:NAD-dependent epimerase/dehydratase family protein [Lusitaniella coriacea LEGE 07157]|uniref:NAD-dependent epimerase/dehydratase family protein n=1 Tax=Lusitaniella coriacea LEGE 07157 TaxID=945747 RepID=A0A8J7B6E3_9CYAN|nr:NAD-dependent epimerase/dehydratase family protein [Lusitaniella coriacea]MBE9114289.1 NAD-dependent epimerase/dehydratase family protein [Lusitaniella coriacea LEGE 07157]